MELFDSPGRVRISNLSRRFQGCFLSGPEVRCRRPFCLCRRIPQKIPLDSLPGLYIRPACRDGHGKRFHCGVSYSPNLSLSQLSVSSRRLDTRLLRSRRAGNGAHGPRAAAVPPVYVYRVELINQILRMIRKAHSDQWRSSGYESSR